MRLREKIWRPVRVEMRKTKMTERMAGTQPRWVKATGRTYEQADCFSFASFRDGARKLKMSG